MWTHPGVGGPLLAVVLADQQPGVPPLHVEVSVQCDAEVLVRYLAHTQQNHLLWIQTHLRNVLDVDPDGDEGRLGKVGQVILLVVLRDTDLLPAPDSAHQLRSEQTQQCPQEKDSRTDLLSKVCPGRGGAGASDRKPSSCGATLPSSFRPDPERMKQKTHSSRIRSCAIK